MPVNGRRAAAYTDQTGMIDCASDANFHLVLSTVLFYDFQWRVMIEFHNNLYLECKDFRNSLLTADTIPHNTFLEWKNYIRLGSVVRALDWRSKGRGFASRQEHKKNFEFFGVKNARIRMITYSR